MTDRDVMQAHVTVRLFAAARAAADASEVSTAPGTVAVVLDTVVQQHPGLGRVLPVCSVLLDGRLVRDTATMVAAGATLDVLPPFAGG